MKFSTFSFLLCVALFVRMIADCRRTKVVLVIGGNNVTDINKYPWMARLYENGKFTCGGTLINSKYVLTAAHCVINANAKRITIRLLELNQTGGHKNSPITRKVNQIIMHDYNPNDEHSNDIALLRLDRKVKLGQTTGYPRPICLPPKEESFTNMNGTIIGWGRTEPYGESAKVLQELEVPIMSNTVCKKMGYGTSITPNKICAGFLEAGKSTCYVMDRGDSGGPLMVMINSHYYIVGIVSYALGCVDYPTVYTRVNRYLKWISKNTKDA